MVRKHPKLGWRKSKFNSKDYLHISAATIPTSVILSQFLPAIRNQGNVGSCVGFGIGANLTGTAKKVGVYKEWFSPEWIYNGARYIEGTLSEDAGADPADALSWLSKKGCLLEEYWPYNPNVVDTTSPPSKYGPLASQWPLLTYTRVVNGTAGICSAISQNYLVSIGTPWFDSWMNIGSTGVLPSVTVNSSVAGGHETLLY